MEWFYLLLTLKYIVKHFLETEKEFMLKASRRNAMVPGLDCIPLDANDDHVTALMFANENHELWKNGGDMELSIPVHCSDSPIVYSPIFGSIAVIDVMFSPFPDDADPVKLAQWEKEPDGSWRSGEERDTYGWHTKFWNWAEPGKDINIAADQYMTYYAEEGEEVVWVMYAGRESATKPHIDYSNADLNARRKAKDMDLPMDEEYMMKLLKKTFDV